jgi:hypothetical protein
VLSLIRGMKFHNPSPQPPPKDAGLTPAHRRRRDAEFQNMAPPSRLQVIEGGHACERYLVVHRSNMHATIPESVFYIFNSKL